MSKLELTFCMEPLAREYRTKRHHFVAYLLGYEGKGSLISYLRKKFVIYFHFKTKSVNVFFLIKQEIGVWN